MVSPEESGIMRWSMTIQYLLRNNAQSSRVSLAIADLQAVSQGFLKTKQELVAKLNQTICCCRNEHPLDEVFTRYIDDLIPQFA